MALCRQQNKKIYFLCLRNKVHLVPFCAKMCYLIISFGFDPACFLTISCYMLPVLSFCYTAYCTKSASTNLLTGYPIARTLHALRSACLNTNVLFFPVTMKFWKTSEVLSPPSTPAGQLGRLPSMGRVYLH